MTSLKLPASGNIRVTFGNLFDGTACIIRDGCHIWVDAPKPVYRCDQCGIVHNDKHYPLPLVVMRGWFLFLVRGDPVCPACNTQFTGSPGGRRHHFGPNTPCFSAINRFWCGVKALWHRISASKLVKLPFKWLYPNHISSTVRCDGCDRRFSNSGNLLNGHYRKEGGRALCRSCLWVMISDGRDHDRSSPLLGHDRS